jgi:hypothetical protein
MTGKYNCKTKKNRQKKNRGGSLTALGSAALLAKAKGIGVGLKGTLKHLGHMSHLGNISNKAKHGFSAIDDIFLAIHKHKKNKKKTYKLGFQESLDVNEIDSVIKQGGIRKSLKRNKNNHKTLQL